MKELYAIAKKQCLVGVLFDGIKKLAEGVGTRAEATDAMDLQCLECSYMYQMGMGKLQCQR